uniref:Uncharacterized protein n=1 Tax=Rhizophora mucronata TaxID=61149 RepID=A0A2P2NX00_RHIMU
MTNNYSRSLLVS